MAKGARQRCIAASEVIKNAKLARGTIQARKQAAEVAKLLGSSHHSQVRILAAEFIGDMQLRLPEERCISFAEAIGKQLQQPDPGTGFCLELTLGIPVVTSGGVR